tara:strand:+ start:76610 stop:76870 length:261 start_codon:yes stop_codon:yes gene_type:complete
MKNITEKNLNAVVAKAETLTNINTLVDCLKCINASVSYEVFSTLMTEILLDYPDEIQKIVKRRYFKECNKNKLEKGQQILAAWELG